eukprot:c13810_g1_i2.p1 GENE.c13810_g1_i2~~c13810_g1_i2.p1  ORF type:complete len:844 (+),score=164.53 c13810_g1_i2:113-2644(+)
MIVNEVSEIPVAPAIPSNQFRKWVVRRRFSAELKKRRARQLGGDEQRPFASSLPRRSLSDMSWATTRDEVELLVKELSRSNTDEITHSKSQFFVVRDIVQQFQRRSLRRGDVVVPTKTQRTSPKLVASVEIPASLTDSNGSLSSGETPEPPNRIPETIDALLSPVESSPGQEFTIENDPLAVPMAAPIKEKVKTKKPKVTLQFDTEAPKVTIVRPDGEVATCRQLEKAASYLRNGSENKALEPQTSSPNGFLNELTKTSSLKSMSRKACASMHLGVQSERRRKRSVSNSSLPDYTYHQKSPFKGLSHWVNRQVSVIGRILNTHLDVDHYSYITHMYPPSSIDHDMNLPLAHYFISSGHNSYLTGNQMTSQCSAQPIMAALKKGCRVIELDIWNDKKGPRVVHGFTMTKPTDFERCIKTVRKYAFCSSTTPLIITLENHCNEANKELVVQILNNELGEMIHWTKQGRKSSVKYRAFPSPASLKRRVLIRDKDDTVGDGETVLSDRPSIEADGMGESSTSFGDIGIGHSMKHFNVMATGNFLPSRSGKNFLDLTVAGSHASLHRSFRLGALFGHNKTILEQGPTARAKGLVDFISIINVKASMVQELGFAVSFSKSEASLGELSIEPEKYRNITRTHLMRIYPNARRIDSSNYDPFTAWLLGAQIVAMNWQTPGVPMWVYKGFFLANGGCGYIRKPLWMMSETFTDVNEMPVAQMLSVQVLSARSIGHRFAQENYVQVDLYGIPKDTCSYRTRTCKAIDACTWDDVIHMPVRCVELGVLLLMLRYKEVVTGHVAIPLSNLKQGIYVFPLLNKYCKPHVSRRNIALVLDIQLRPATGNLKKLLQGE